MSQAKQFITFAGVTISVFAVSLSVFMITKIYQSVPESPRTASSTPKPLTKEQLSRIDNALAFSTGSKDAKVVVVEFTDYLCEHCRTSAPQMNSLIETYKNDSVRFVIRHFPIASPFSLKAALASLCAEEQGKFMDMRNLLTESKKSLNDLIVAQFARDLHLDMDAFASCFSTEKYKNRVAKDVSDAQDLGIQGTPTYFVNSRRFTGTPTLQSFQQAIDQELNL